MLSAGIFALYPCNNRTPADFQWETNKQTTKKIRTVNKIIENMIKQI